MQNSVRHGAASVHIRYVKQLYTHVEQLVAVGCSLQMSILQLFLDPAHDTNLFCLWLSKLAKLTRLFFVNS